MRKYITMVSLSLLVGCITVNEKRQTTPVLSYYNAPAMKQESSNAMVIDLKISPSTILSEDLRLNSTYEFTPLQMPNNKFIALANWVIMCRDHILIVDREIGKKVDIFDCTGRWVADIDNKGRGRGEYISFYGALYDKIEDLIMVDAGTHILYYNFEGKFAKKIESSYGGWAYPYGDKILHDVGKGQMFDSDKMYNLSVSIEDSVIYRGIPYCKMRKRDGISLSNRCFYETSSGETLYRPQYRDTIYQISSDSTYFAKYVVMQDKSIWELNDRRLSKNIEEYIRDGYTDIMPPFYETSDFLYFTRRRFIDKQGTVIESIFYNKSNRQCYALSSLLRLDPLFNRIVTGLYSNVIGINNNSFIGYISKEKLDELAKHIAENPDVNIVNNEFQKIVDERERYRGVIYEVEYSI